MSCHQSPDLHTASELNALELRKQSAKISAEMKQQAGRVSILRERNKCTRGLLRDEARHIEASILQSRAAGVHGTTDYLKTTEKKNSMIWDEMKRQDDVIARLAQYCDGAMDRFEQHTTQIMSLIDRQAKRVRDIESENNSQKKTICDLQLRAAIAEYGHQEQTRVAKSMEGRLTKLKEVINSQAQVMLLELDYQQELIIDLDLDAEYFQPSHRTLMDMTENIEHWTADDGDSEMTFDFEPESNSRETISELENKIKLQSLQLDEQKRKLDEQTATIFQLQVQTRKLALDLEEQNEKVVCLQEDMNREDEESDATVVIKLDN